MIELLIEGGADVNYGNKLHSDWAAIHWAALTDNKLVNSNDDKKFTDERIDAGGGVCAEE